MATTDELLTAVESEDMEEETSGVDYFVIDNDLRTITIPDSETILGVASDDSVHRLYFKMPSTYGEFDLSEFTIRVNYMNTGDYTGDLYLVDDAVSDGEYITFSWLAGRNATANAGTTTFSVCLKLYDDDANVIQEFNTTTASLTVLIGLETTEGVTATYADIIQQILNLVDTDAITNTITTALTQAKESGDFDGASAYEVAVENGYEGTEEEWLASLKGDTYTLTDTDKSEIAELVLTLVTDGDEVSY